MVETKTTKSRESAPSLRRALSRLMKRPEFGALTGALVLFIFFSLVSDVFLQPTSFATVLYGSSIIGIVAVGVALLMIGGEVDLSAGVAVTASALMSALISWHYQVNVWVGVVMGLVFALLVGYVNGILFVKTKLPSFIVTLSTFLMLAGANLALTRMVSGGVSSPSIAGLPGFASAKAVFASTIPIGGVSVSVTVFIWIALVIVGSWVLRHTRVGNWIFASGGDARAARAAGVPVDKVKIGLFMGVAFCAWIAAMHTLFAFNVVQSGEGVGNEFLYIIAAIIGGCLMTGGYGSVIGAAIGAFIFGMANKGIIYAGWEPDWFKFFLGATLLLAVIVNLYVRKQSERHT